MGLGLGIGISLGRGGALLEWRPSQLAGCVLWLRADLGITKDGSNRVSAWADQSGTGDANKHAVQAVAGVQPLWNAASANLANRPSLTFAKARSDRMTSGTWSTAMPNPATWFAAVYHASEDTNGGVIIDGTGANRHAIFFDAAHARSAYAGASLPGGTATAPPATRVVGVKFGVSAAFYDSARTVKATGTTGSQTLTVLRVGAESALTAGYFFDGEIAEVIGYNRALSQAEVETVLVALGARYGITIGA